MKTLKVGCVQCWCGALCFLVFSAWMARGAESTAFELIKEGNRYIGEQSKDKVVGIYSEKSIAGLTPDIWYVAYFDPDSKSRPVEVKFGAGRQMGVKHRSSVFSGSKAEKILDIKKLKVDSDKAIKTATAEPLLAKLTLKATQLWLENTAGTPVWKVRLWAAKLAKPDVSADIGEIFISAETGEVVKSDLKPNKVD
jgi:hypothetical protein